MSPLTTTQCCIVGGGPAGLVLGYLLARAGVEVIVLEKHADFLRDFRGDTIHPSTMEILQQLGLLTEFLQLPHQRVPRLFAQFGPDRLLMADFSRLRVTAPFIAMMPQWDFLNFLAQKAKALPGFRLLMEAEARELVTEDGRITGVVANTPNGLLEINAVLTVAADGRTSRMREAAGLRVHDLGAPIDVLWFRLSRRPGDTEETQGRFDAGQIFIMLNRGEYWQCAYVVPKGGFDTRKANGIAAFRGDLAKLLPMEADRAEELETWEQVKPLSVQVNRLETWWRPGLLCIGDAAHAMSPVGGVGVNLAVQDAVAAANLLADPLRHSALVDRHLQAVQRRRIWPTRATQRLQILVQNRVLLNALRNRPNFRAPVALRLISSIPVLRDIPGQIVGIGLRPERPNAVVFRTGAIIQTR
jgi:2-polyprenyl-6-methoxyphenol hydroxylase-like FAD-dependent oxidoreductase